VRNKIEGNIWKLFVAEVTQREYYFPVLAIYFLTLPDANAQQIGMWAGIGFFSEFIFEIPSGYISDRIGHKPMLILAKLSMIAAVLSFIVGSSQIYFILGAIFVAFSFAAQSGTKTALLRETLAKLGKEKMLAAANSRIFANAKLLSAFLLILIPLGVNYSIKSPFYLTLVIDVIGLLAVLFLINPNGKEKVAPKKSILKIVYELRGTGFFPVVIFTSAITGFSIAQMTFIAPYLDTLGFPIVFLGLLAGLRSLGQFVVGNKIVKFEERMNIKGIFLFDILLFTASFALIALLNNFYLIALILIVVGSYAVGRNAFIDGYLGKHYVKDKNYMATTLSIKGQIAMMFNFVAVFGIGYVMNYSYKLGFYVMGGALFLILLGTYFFVENRKTTR